MPGIDLQYAFGLEPKDAVAYFESKGYVLGFKWQDVAAEVHAKAFTVAGVMKVDVLQDIRQALTDALKNGKTLEQFKDGLIPTLQRKGWMGGGHIVDQDTGEIQGKRLTPRRLNTIFQTNLQSAYMAGRYKAQMAQVDTRPYWEYVAVMDNRTRPAHAALNGEVYRYDDPFWATFYPPNGYRCRCRVRTRTAREVEREDMEGASSGGRLEEVEQQVGRDGKTQPAIGYKSPITGKVVTPDPGFGCNPGQEWQRPFTPPPLDTLPKSIPHGVELPPLPAATRINQETMLPPDLSPEAYARAFLQEFGADVGHPVVFKDAMDEPLQVNEWLFQDGAGHWKADKFGRGPYMKLLAEAIKAPDEIWMAWVELNGQWKLRRRYIKALETPEGDWGLAVFESGQDGWTGVTTFPAKVGKSAAARKSYIDQQRGTFLAYRRQK